MIALYVLHYCMEFSLLLFNKFLEPKAVFYQTLLCCDKSVQQAQVYVMMNLSNNVSSQLFSRMTWDIIFWDDCVDYVPSNWANSTKTTYMWPSHIKSPIKIKEMIKTCEKPALDGKWTEHKAVFKKTVCDVNIAEKYCKKMQYDSNVSQLSSDNNSTDFEDELDSDSLPIKKRKQSSVEHSSDVSCEQMLCYIIS